MFTLHPRDVVPVWSSMFKKQVYVSCCYYFNHACSTAQEMIVSVRHPLWSRLKNLDKINLTFHPAPSSGQNFKLCSALCFDKISEILKEDIPILRCTRCLAC